MYTNKELQKLEEYLKEKNIKHHNSSDKYIERISITEYSQDEHVYISVVCSRTEYGTYGSEKGLLEYWDLHGEPIGYLDANDVIKKIKEHNKETHRIKIDKTTITFYMAVCAEIIATAALILSIIGLVIR